MGECFCHGSPAVALKKQHTRGQIVVRFVRNRSRSVPHNRWSRPATAPIHNRCDGITPTLRLRRKPNQVLSPLIIWWKPFLINLHTYHVRRLPPLQCELSTRRRQPTKF